MLGIQLSALSAAEVRRLLDAARARGQDSLVRQLEAELAARPGRNAGQPLPMSTTPRPAPRPDPRLASARYRPTQRPSRGPAIAVAGLAAFIGAALAWGISLTPPQAARPVAQPVTLAADQAPARVAVALTTQLAEEPTSPPADLALEPPVDDTGPVKAAAAPSSSHNPCYDLPTARERLVCGYPSLAIQDRRMKAALERARAGGDAGAVDDAQAQWLQASANISDREVLADRYARRVAELEAR